MRSGLIKHGDAVVFYSNGGLVPSILPKLYIPALLAFGPLVFFYFLKSFAPEIMIPVSYLVFSSCLGLLSAAYLAIKKGDQKRYEIWLHQKGPIMRCLDRERGEWMWTVDVDPISFFLYPMEVFGLNDEKRKSGK